MNKSQGTNAPENGDQSTTGINRSEVVRRLMIAGGAGFVLPGFAEGRPTASPIVGGSSVAETDTKIAQSDRSPAFLDQHQSDTLKVLAERIIPESSEAQVNRFVDLLLSVDTEEPQEAFVASLSAFEAESPSGAFPTPLGTLLKPSKTKFSVPLRRQNPGMLRTGSLSNSPCAITLKTSKAGSPAPITRRKPL